MRSSATTQGAVRSTHLWHLHSNRLPQHLMTNRRVSGVPGGPAAPVVQSAWLSSRNWSPCGCSHCHHEPRSIFQARSPNMCWTQRWHRCRSGRKIARHPHGSAGPRPLRSAGRTSCRSQPTASPAPAAAAAAAAVAAAAAAAAALATTSTWSIRC